MIVKTVVFLGILLWVFVFAGGVMWMYYQKHNDKYLESKEYDLEVDRLRKGE